MQYSSGRRNTYGSSSVSGGGGAVSSRLSIPSSHRTSTTRTGAYSSSVPSSTGGTYTGTSPASRYSSAYSTSAAISPRPTSTSATRYSRFSTGSAPGDTASSRYRTSRYDSHYSSYGGAASGASSRRSSDIGSDIGSRYTSPASVTTRPYVTASSGVSTSRESSLSKSWPSPARHLGSTVNLPRYDASVRSSSSTVASTVAARQRRSPVIGAGSVPALASPYYSGTESRRGSTRSVDLTLNRTPSSSALLSQISRRYRGGSGSGTLDGNFSAGRAESLYRPSTKYTIGGGGGGGGGGSSRFLTSGLDTTGGGTSSRRASVLSTSSSVRGMSRSPVRGLGSPSPGPTSKTLWNKYYGQLSARWAEQTGGTLNSAANGKNQYSYRPGSTTGTPRKMSLGGTVSDGSVDVTVDSPSSSTTTAAAALPDSAAVASITAATGHSRSKKKTRKKKEDSDGYDDSSSSSDGDAEKTEKTSGKSKADSPTAGGSKPAARIKRTNTNGGTSGTGSFRRSRASGNSTSTGTTVAPTTLSYSTPYQSKRDGHASSSDNETAQDSLDARIKARRKRLQKSKAMLQEHKEDGWNYRRTLQIEESKQRQQTSAAATISYSRTEAPTRRDQQDDERTRKSDSNATTITTTAVDVDEKQKPSRSPRRTNTATSRSPSALDENAATAGVRVQKIYFPSPSKDIGTPSVTQSDHESTSIPPRMQPDVKPMLMVDERTPQRQTASLSRSPAPTVINVGVKKLIDQEKPDANSTYRRSSPLRISSSISSSNRAISNERTPPAPISQRQDFDYNQYVTSIAPKQISYENPAAALIEADQEQQLEDLSKCNDTKPLQNGVNDEGNDDRRSKVEPAKKTVQKITAGGIKINNPPSDHTRIAIKTKPIRTQPPSVVVVTAVSPPSPKRNVNNNVSKDTSSVNGATTNAPADLVGTSTKAAAPIEVTPPSSNSLNTIPTPYRRASASPGRVVAAVSVEDSAAKPSLSRLTPSRSREKLDSFVKAPEVIKRRGPDDDERKRHSSAQQKKAVEINYAVVNGESKGGRLPSATPERSTPTTIVIPMTMIPAKNVPETITPTFTPTFTQPVQSQLSPQSSSSLTKDASREPSMPKTRATHEPVPPARAHRSHESTPLSVANNQRAIAMAAAKEAEEKLRLEIIKHQRRADLKKESMADMHRLPSVDREMLNLLTLGEELNNSRSSLSTANNQHPSAASKFAQSFRTAMPQKGGGSHLPVPPDRQRKRLTELAGGGGGSIQGSRESLNSFNVLPKPWRPSLQGSREGSSESLASSFATAASHTGNPNRGSKDSLNTTLTYPKESHLNVYPKPWSSSRGLGGRDKLSTSAEPLPTLAETPGETVPTVPPRSHGHRGGNSGGGKNTSSLELATKKVDEMLRLAKLKHQQQQRREKIILFQSQKHHPQNLTVITSSHPADEKSGSNPILDASKELDKAYEAIQLDYAEAQESRMRQRNKKNQHQHGSISDNENVFVRPQLVTVFSTVHMPSPRRAESGDEGVRRRTHQHHHYYHRDTSAGGGRLADKAYSYRKSDPHQQPPNGPIGAPYDNSKMDYTKRWLEGDLRSLTRDTKPDLLQFGSAPRLDFDQRSVGSASAEVAAITNKDRLRAMREVPDLVPQQQHHTKYHHHQSHHQGQHQHQHQQQSQHSQQKSHLQPHLVKPSPVVPSKASNSRQASNYDEMLAPNILGSHLLGPRVGQTGSKSSSFAGGLPSLQSSGGESRHGHHPGQRHHQGQQQSRPFDDPQQASSMNFNSGGIRQAGDQLRSSVESLTHSDRSWIVPKNVSQGIVRKQVDMFDKMSDNDSELSFRSADNVAYRSALSKPNRRLSLTDHMANFVRRFESDEESTGNGSGVYRRAPQQRQAYQELYSDDEARIASIRNGAFFKRPLAHQHLQSNGGGGGGGSTQSLPVALPYHHQHHHGQRMTTVGGGQHQHHGGGGQGHFQQAAPHFYGQPQVPPPRGAGYFGSHSHEQLTPKQQHRKVIPPWLRQREPPPKQQYWSSNSTLTDLEAPGVSQYYPSGHGKKPMHSTDTMQAVDSLVAELELNTDASSSIVSQRSLNNFPVDRHYYHSHYQHQPMPVEIDRSSSRSKLNAIPEQAEQQQMDTLHLAQKRLEEARRDLKNVQAVGIRRSMARDKPHGLLADNEAPINTALRAARESHSSGIRKPNEPFSNSSLPRSFGAQQQQLSPNDAQPIKYRQQHTSSKAAVIGRPASYAAPPAHRQSAAAAAHPFGPGGSAEHIIQRQPMMSLDKEEDNYDNVFIGNWQRATGSQRSKMSAPELPRSTVPSRNLSSPNSIKIGSIVLGRSGTPTGDHQQYDSVVHSQADRHHHQQQSSATKNPLKNFFQLFNKSSSGSKVNGDSSMDNSMHESHRSYPDERTSVASSQRVPSTLSLNVGPAEPSANSSTRNSVNMSGSMIDGNHFHKSCSSNDAYSLKSTLTPQEMRQLDELLTSFHDDGSKGGQRRSEQSGQRSKGAAEGQTAAANGGGAKAEKTGKGGEKKSDAQEQQQRSPSKFKLGLPAFWKRA